MSKYICHRESREQFNHIGESLGMSGDSAIYYAKSIGKRRCYRQGYPNLESKGLKLFEFKTEAKAQQLCDHTNNMHNDNFKPLLVD